MKKVLKITQIALTSIALLISIFWFGYTISYLNCQEELCGIGIAFGLVFHLIADGVTIFLTIVGIILYFVFRRQEQVKTHKQYLILNIIFLAVSIILGVTLILIVNAL